MGRLRLPRQWPSDFHDSLRRRQQPVFLLVCLIRLARLVLSDCRSSTPVQRDCAFQVSRFSRKYFEGLGKRWFFRNRQTGRRYPTASSLQQFNSTKGKHQSNPRIISGASSLRTYPVALTSAVAPIGRRQFADTIGNSPRPGNTLLRYWRMCMWCRRQVSTTDRMAATRGLARSLPTCSQFFGR